MNHTRTVAHLLGCAALSCCFALTSTACITENAGVGDTSCPPDECGVNASTLNDLLFGENHLTPGMNNGNPSDAGAKVVDFVFVDPDPTALLLIADGTLEVDVGGQLLRGEDILGSKLIVEDVRNPMMGRQLIDVHFEDTRRVETWTNTGSQVAQYIFAYENDDGDYVSVCSGAADTSEPAAWAVLLTGEKYSLETRSVIGTEAGIFNIACAGTALYKMKMMGYEPLREPNSFVKEHQRHATLKMLVADYCDSGSTFTEDGTPVQWMNSGGWSFNYPEPSGTVEAYWDQTGALCLDTPRMGADLVDDIRADCAAVGRSLPSCAGFSGDYEWVTHLPE